VQGIAEHPLAILLISKAPRMLTMFFVRWRRSCSRQAAVSFASCAVGSVMICLLLDVSAIRPDCASEKLLAGAYHCQRVVVQCAMLAPCGGLRNPQVAEHR
jgi:hypothetical protein